MNPRNPWHLLGAIVLAGLVILGLLQVGEWLGTR